MDTPKFEDPAYQELCICQRWGLGAARLAVKSDLNCTGDSTRSLPPPTQHETQNPHTPPFFSGAKGFFLIWTQTWGFGHGSWYLRLWTWTQKHTNISAICHLFVALTGKEKRQLACMCFWPVGPQNILMILPGQSGAVLP